MSESGTKKEIRLAIGGREDTRLFNNPVGHGWVGDAKQLPNGDVLIKHARRVSFGLFPGSADCVGWRSVVVTPDMVGKLVAIFTSLEIKSATGRPTKEQNNWAQQVTAAGGLAGIARSVADALRIITGG